MGELGVRAGRLAGGYCRDERLTPSHSGCQLRPLSPPPNSHHRPTHSPRHLHCHCRCPLPASRAYLRSGTRGTAAASLAAQANRHRGAHAAERSYNARISSRQGRCEGVSACTARCQLSGRLTFENERIGWRCGLTPHRQTTPATSRQSALMEHAAGARSVERCWLLHCLSCDGWSG